ncbi:ornithine cyclodeaminase [Oikeobacillus pervagus]|uniref:Ornithine cyclodeaminase n=1 Tax=Oikeobacillus pervagus TaxID=1325931 RepID=A0AAJ1SZJ9_9BACI|nr:ornithine cyclodeaminase family protein [Oikeobacillus pervagus]MDQ0214147.1 ornithine cyclodeaminase [Oikeobacillus pervagus]
MLVLNEANLLQATSMKEIIDVVEDAYTLYDKGQFQMPIRNQIRDQDNSFLLMPCIANQSIGTKIVSVFPNNKKKLVTQGIVVLNDRKDGSIKALLNGTLLTGLKTGAVGGVAIKHLSPSNVQSVGLIGTGYQGLYQLMGASVVRDIQHIYLYNRSPSKLPAFIHNLQNLLHSKQKIHVVESPLELVQQAEIIITSTSANSPVLPNVEGLFNGKLIIGIGSYQPHMREFPDQLYTNIKQIFIDTIDAKKETGDLIDPLQNQWVHPSQVIPFSEVVTKKVVPTISDEYPTVFKSTGMALFDLLVAEKMYEKAVQKQIGEYVNL